ncbi:hypothetical protein ACFOU2_16780 [Bacillus songklensis]|uniref:Uncharacterized protein n=1 Tax=Bacillus songklensis TaxID=1069116 RepID=A0ABV8B6N0_9BACI
MTDITTLPGKQVDVKLLKRNPFKGVMTNLGLSNENLPVNPSNVPLLRSLEGELKKLEEELVV